MYITRCESLFMES